MSITQILLVGLGGAIGALLRFGCMTLCSRFKFIPLATIVANGLGSFSLALVLYLDLDKFYLLVLAVGISSSLSTLSSLCNDLYSLLTDKAYIRAIIYLYLNICISFMGISFALSCIDTKKIL